MSNPTNHCVRVEIHFGANLSGTRPGDTDYRLAEYDAVYRIIYADGSARELEAAEFRGVLPRDFSLLDGINNALSNLASIATPDRAHHSTA